MLYPCITSQKKKKEREAAFSWTQIMLQAHDESTVHAARSRAGGVVRGGRNIAIEKR